MIVVITGLMASGKSTVAQLVASGLEKAVHLRGDTFRRMIVSGREDMADPPTEEALRQLRMRYRLTARAAREYHRGGFNVIVQDNYYGQMLPWFLGLLEPYEPKTVVLCPSAAAIAAREQGRDKAGYGGYAMQPLYQAFMADTPRLGLWLDNSAQTPEETAQHVLAYMRSGTLPPQPAAPT